MAKAANKRIVIFLLFLSSILFPQNIKSPINDKYVKAHEENYSILIAGHLYGSPRNYRSVFPAASILGSLNEINKIDCSFFVTLGDNFRIPNDIQIDNYKKSFSERLKFPIFNVVGNHDVKIRQNYVKNFGETYYNFSHGSELYVFLDSELDNSKLMGKQLEYFIDVISQKANDHNIKNVFIFSHRLIWAVNIKKYEVVYRNLNCQDGYVQDHNFKSIIIPALTELSKEKNVFWISGVFGSSWSLPLFYDIDNKTGITFIATGLGVTENDLMLKVDIKRNDVKIFPISLGNTKMKDIEHFGIQYWEEYFSGFPEKYFLKIYKMLLQKYY